MCLKNWRDVLRGFVQSWTQITEQHLRVRWSGGYSNRSDNRDKMNAPEQLLDNFGPQEDEEGKSLLRQLRERAGLTEFGLARELSISGKAV